jgi:cell division protein FtsX
MAGGQMSGRRGSPEVVETARVFVPISIYDELLPILVSGERHHHDHPFWTEWIARAVDERSVPQAAQQLRGALTQLLPNLADELHLSEPTHRSLREYFSLRGLAAKRSAFACAVLLLVALTGLGNTLLVSLLEQTRAIAIRRALGARKWQVLLPSLAEGTALAAVGTALGLLLAYASAAVLRSGFDGLEFLSLRAFWPIASAAAMLQASVLVSLMPGYLATRVDPAAGLRYE